MNEEEIPAFTVSTYANESKSSSFPMYVLGVDVGGTHTDIAVAGILKKVPSLICSLHFQTDYLTGILPAMDQALQYAKQHFDIDIQKACIGAAGIISSDMSRVQLTNASWSINRLDLIQHTSLDHVFLLNDFQTIGYGINQIDHESQGDLITINKPSTENNKETKAVLGAGTGLGKTILSFDATHEVYIPLPSEGGHSDLPLYSQDEVDMSSWIQQLLHRKQPLRYEDVLSGNGLSHIYSYLRQTDEYPTSEITQRIDKSPIKAPLISQYRTIDETCKTTFDWFTRFYARCAKNLALDALATGGIYIAGGIAIKNHDLFQSSLFLDEFLQSFNRTDLLKTIPIYLIKNYDISLLGACFAAGFLD